MDENQNQQQIDHSEPFSLNEFRDQIRNMATFLTSKRIIPPNLVSTLQTQTERYADSLNIHYTDDVSDKSNETLISIAFSNLVLAQQSMYRAELDKIAMAFGLDPVEDAQSLIEAISTDLGLDSIKGPGTLADQILIKMETSTMESQGTDSLSQNSSSCLSINYQNEEEKLKERKQVAELKAKAKLLESTLMELQEKAKKKMKRNSAKLGLKILEIDDALQKEKKLSDKIMKENEVLKIRNQNLENEREDYEHRIEMLANSKTTENNGIQILENIIKSSDQISIQFSNQLEELRLQAENKANLVLIITKLQRINKIFEDELVKSLKMQESNNELSKNSGYSPKPLFEDEFSLFDSVADIVANINSSVVDDIIETINDTEATPEEKVKDTITSLTNEILRLKKELTKKADQTDDSTSSGSVQRLLSVIHSQLNFIERLSNSDQERNWLLNVHSPDDARKALIQQSSRLQLFLSEYADGFVSDSDVFDCIALDDSENPLSIADRLKEYLNSYPVVKASESQELFALLRQSYAACNILRRFAVESRSQCLIQASELRSLRNELTASRNDFEAQLEESVSALQQQLEIEVQQRERAEESISEVINVLQANVDQAAAVPEILNCIYNLQHYDEVLIDQETFEKTLESKLSTAFSQLLERDNELSEFKENAAREIQEIRASSQSLEEEAQTVIQAKTTELEECKIQIASLKNETMSLQDEANESRDIAESLRDQLESEKEKASTRVNTMRKELDVIKRKMDKRLTKSTIAIATKEREKRKQLKQRMQTVRNENQQLIDQLNEKTRDLQIMQEKLDKSNVESIDKKKKRKDSEKNSSQTMDELRNEIRDLSSKMAEMQVEKRILSEKVQAYEKRQRKDKTVVDAILMKKQNSLESDFHNRQKKLKKDMKEMHQKYITSIFGVFKGIMNVPNPVSDQDAFNMLKAAVKMINPEVKTLNEATYDSINYSALNDGDISLSSPSKENFDQISDSEGQ